MVDTAAPAAIQPAPVARPSWLDDIYAQQGGGAGYSLTPDDIAAVGQWVLEQQMQQQMGQLDVANRQLDLQQDTIGLNEQQLDQQYREFEFMKEQYFPWYTGDYFDFQKQQAQNDLTMSNNQVAMSDNDVLRSRNSVEQARFQTDQAKYGAQAQQMALWQQLGYIPASESLNPRSRYGY